MYNIGIDFHHIRNRDEENHKKMLNNKSSQSNTKFDNTYRLYKHNNYGYRFCHIWNRNEESHTKLKTVE